MLAPGVYDGLSALIAHDVGFEVLYASGGAIARSAGIPDVGLMTLTEVLDRTARIVHAVPTPVIADIDTGYGGPLNVVRTVREFERIGVAGFHIEDQVNPKRCGHYEDKAVVDVPEMLGRLGAALDARVDADLVVIARTDARATLGLEVAIERAQVYARAGADMVFIEAPEAVSEIEVIAHAVAAPLVINMFAGGKTPLVPTKRLARLGYRLILVPSDLQRAAIYAMREAARVLRQEGSSQQHLDQMVSFADRDELVGLDGYIELERKHDRSRQRTVRRAATAIYVKGS